MTTDPLEAISSVYAAATTLVTAMPTFGFDELPQSPVLPYGWYEFDSETEVGNAFTNSVCIETNVTIWCKAADNITLYTIQNLMRNAFTKSAFISVMTNFNGVTTLTFRRSRARAPDRNKSAKRTWLLEAKFAIRSTVQLSGGYC